jgi:hypothetical protein
MGKLVERWDDVEFARARGAVCGVSGVEVRLDGKEEAKK